MANNFPVKSYFHIQRQMLRLSGISLNENENLFYKSCCAALQISFLVYIFALAYDIVVEFQDLDVVINSLFHAIGLFIVLLKTWVVTSNAGKLSQALMMLQNGVFVPNQERGGSAEEMWINECVTNSNRLTIIATILTTITTSIPIVASMVRRLMNDDPQYWELPFGKCSVVNLERYFDLAWLFQSVMLNFAGIIFISTDFLVVLVFAHICVQLKMVRNSVLKNLTPTTRNQRNNNDGRKHVQEEWRYLAFKLKENVLYHMAIIDLAKQIENVLNVLMLNTYLAEMFTLGCIMYHGSLYPAWDPRFQRDAVLIAAVIFEVFLTSYWGNEVMVQSQMLLDACYEVYSVGTDMRLQKGLYIMMMGSLRPIKFTAGKFVNLSLITFVGVIRASFSYYMVLQSVNTKR